MASLVRKPVHTVQNLQLAEQEASSLLRNLPIHRYVCLCMIKYSNEVAKAGGQRTKTRIEAWRCARCGPPHPPPHPSPPPLPTKSSEFRRGDDVQCWLDARIFVFVPVYYREEERQWNIGDCKFLANKIGEGGLDRCWLEFNACVESDS